MTENITYGDIIAMQDANGKTKTGGTMATVLGIVGAILVIALIWNAYAQNRHMANGSEKNTSLEIGELRAGQRYQNEMITLVNHNERQDALRIAYTDGALSRPYPFAHYGGYPPLPPYGGPHGHHDGCGTHQKFQEVKSFNVDTDVATLTTTCGC
jgi:hypothetical protein